MSENGSNGFDPLGLKSLGKASEKIIDFGLNGAKAFLKATCLPLLEEIGLMGRDQFAYWKLNNIIKMLEKAKGKLHYDPETQKLVIDPRVALQIAENASQVSNDILLDMWAGLFAASCDRYEEDENIFFIDLLKRLTSSQVKLISYLCENSLKRINISNVEASKIDGVVFAEDIRITYPQLCEIMESDSRLKVDTEFDSLENMGLIAKSRHSPAGFALAQLIKTPNGTPLSPTLKTLRLYIKCQGSSKTPFDYFLEDVNNYYYDIIKDYIDVEPSDTLNYITEISAIGATYKDDIEYGNHLTLKNEEWVNLPTDELSERLRSWAVFRYVSFIGKAFMVKVNQTDFATFNYKDGIKKIGL